MDLQISFPGTGRIRFLSEALFSDPHSALARQFFERAFLAPEVEQVEIDSGRQKAEISFRADAGSSRAVIKKISRFLAKGTPALSHLLSRTIRLFELYRVAKSRYLR
jgi:Cu2+-exporting ATPase